MKLIICGSRDIERMPSETMTRAIHLLSWQGGWREPSLVLSGGCRGVDSCGEAWATTMGIPVRRFPADWSLGKKAGPLRNQAMVDEADAVVAIMYADGRGTRDCVRRAIAKGIPVAMLILPRSKP